MQERTIKHAIDTYIKDLGDSAFSLMTSKYFKRKFWPNPKSLNGKITKRAALIGGGPTYENIFLFS